MSPTNANIFSRKMIFEVSLLFVNNFKEMLTILLLINVIYCEADWIKISQIPTSEFDMYSTESAINFAGNNEKTSSATPIRYEDLEHIIGPGFEDELEKFYQRHKEEMDQKRKDEKDKELIEKTKNYEDPWSVYDKPLHVSKLEEPVNIANDEDSEEQHNRYEEYEEFEHANISSMLKYKNTTIDTMPLSQPRPKIVQLKFVKVTPKQSGSYFSGFLKFLRDIQTSFVTKTARSIKDKIQTLEQFRDDLLMNIEERIKSLWPSTPVVRSKRGIIGDHHGGGMEFPSSEAALMTISFLTFAVFLIKLVLQVINTIKSKHYSYNSFDTSGGGSGGAMQAVSIIKQNRNARKLSLTHDELHGMKSVLTSIDNVGKF